MWIAGALRPAAIEQGFSAVGTLSRMSARSLASGSCAARFGQPRPSGSPERAKWKLGLPSIRLPYIR
jgi:hypothetical protein